MSRDKKRDRGYEVGYKKPPSEHQFSKGKSGNPKGRPKGSKGLLAISTEELDQKISVTSGGVERKVSARRLLIKALIREASKGSIAHLNALMRLDERANPPSPAAAEQEVPELLTREYLEAMTKIEHKVSLGAVTIFTGVQRRAYGRAGLNPPPGSDLAISSMLSTTCNCDDPHLPIPGDELARQIIACRECGRLVDAEIGGPHMITLEQLMALTDLEKQQVMKAGVMLVPSADEWDPPVIYEPPYFHYNENGTEHRVRSPQRFVSQIVAEMIGPYADLEPPSPFEEAERDPDNPTRRRRYGFWARSLD